MRGKLISILCVPMLLATGFLMCMPTATAYTWQHRSLLGWEFDFLDCSSEGLIFQNVYYHTKSVIHDSYQWGIYAWIDNHKVELPMSPYTSCTPYEESDSYHFGHYDTFVFNNVGGYAGVNMQFQPGFVVSPGGHVQYTITGVTIDPGSSHYVTFVYMWWHIFWKFQGTYVYAYKGTTKINTETYSEPQNWGGQASYKDGNNGYGIYNNGLYGKGGGGTVIHEWAAFQDPLDYPYAFPGNANDHETLTHTVGAEYIEMDYPFSGYYGVYTDWFTTWS